MTKQYKGIDIDQMIERGEVDTDTLIAVEDSSDKLRREAEPDAYALTYEEATLIRKAANILGLFHIQDTTSNTNLEFMDKLNSLLDENDIPVNKILDIAERVFNSNWYTLRLVATASPSAEHLAYEIYGRIDGKLSQRVVDNSEWRAYDHTSSERKRRQQLNLPDGTQFIYAGEYETLDILYYYYHTDTDDDIASLRTYRLTDIIYPIDPINNKIWNSIWRINGFHPGKRIAIDTSKANSKARIEVLVSIDWDVVEEDTTITKKLDDFDKLVYTIMSNFYRSGQEVMTLAMIYGTMYDGKQPGKSDRQKLNDSITKMSTAHIYIDNKQEVNNHLDYPEFIYDASLLPMERVRVMLNGEIVDGAIHLLREPPAFTFSVNRNEITTLKRSLLQPPISKTVENLSIQDYLLRRIVYAKGRGSKKILYKTVAKECGITSTKQKQRLPDKIRRFMEHFISNGSIVGAEYDDTSVTVTFTPKKKG